MSKEIEMNVLSLFDGMSCGQIALNRIGIKPAKYYAAELDKHAITVTQANYPETIQMGDVTQWKEWDIDWGSIDLLIGGSPCQGFSFAGKQLAFDDPRSKLFFVYVDILNHIKKHNHDVKFMLENVKMKREHLDVISEHLGVQPVFINSALVSAQNRQRYYWANWTFGQPGDKGILLAGILESGAVDRDKSYCIDANYFKGGSLKNYLDKKRMQVALSQSETRLCVFEEDDARPVRKLTPTECERLQTVTCGFTDHVSNTQRYKMLGNVFTVDVIAHIFKQGLKLCQKSIGK